MKITNSFCFLPSSCSCNSFSGQRSPAWNIWKCVYGRTWFYSWFTTGFAQFQSEHLFVLKATAHKVLNTMRHQQIMRTNTNKKNIKSFKINIEFNVWLKTAGANRITARDRRREGLGERVRRMSRDQKC